MNMKLRKTEKRVLSLLVEQFRRELGATEVRLFGSAARGELTDGSDIDLLVVVPKVNWEVEKKVTALCFAAELEISRLISAVCFTPAELTESPLRHSPLVLNVRKEGIPL